MGDGLSIIADAPGEFVFQHPKDLQDGRVAVTERDILTNLPQVPGCDLCLDHHASEALRNSDKSTPCCILPPEAIRRPARDA